MGRFFISGQHYFHLNIVNIAGKKNLDLVSATIFNSIKERELLTQP